MQIASVMDIRYMYIHYGAATDDVIAHTCSRQHKCNMASWKTRPEGIHRDIDSLMSKLLSAFAILRRDNYHGAAQRSPAQPSPAPLPAGRERSIPSRPGPS